jgi:hypothetical protein
MFIFLYSSGKDGAGKECLVSLFKSLEIPTWVKRKAADILQSIAKKPRLEAPKEASVTVDKIR